MFQQPGQEGRAIAKRLHGLPYGPTEVACPVVPEGGRKEHLAQQVGAQLQEPARLMRQVEEHGVEVREGCDLHAARRLVQRAGKFLQAVEDRRILAHGMRKRRLCLRQAPEGVVAER